MNRHMTPPARSDASGKPGKSRKSARLSAGLILFRRDGPLPLEVFLAHPGGPFWARRDDAAWTIPKGGVEEGEDLLDTARREFQEETGIAPRGPFRDLGSVKQRAGKVVHAWAWEGDADPTTVTSNDMRTEWPRGSGKWIVFPEVDRCCWFDPETARRKLNPAQAELIGRLETSIADDPDGNRPDRVPDAMS
jgi:predicted NUDIX family NTP pyrophosphohydrolase